MNRINQNTTYGDWLDYWFDVYKKPFLSLTSIRNIDQIIRIHTPQRIKKISLKKLSIFDFDESIAAISGGRTRKYARYVWHESLKRAVQVGILKSNILDNIAPVRYRKKISIALTASEQRDFLNRIHGDKIEFLLQFYLFSGVRRAEALTIKWGDVLFDDSIIIIRGTKTCDSYRKIIMTNDLRRILIAQRDQNIESGYPVGKNDLVFCGRHPNGVSRRFRQLCPGHHLHDLRHTFITRCAESGINVSVCQKFVGHATVDMTLNVYTHVMGDFEKNEIQKLKI